MATEKQILDFIEELAPYAQKAYREQGKVLPSICIGMACVESNYGTSPIMRQHNAFFGQKVGTGKTATRHWGGAFFTTRTKEEYTVGRHTTIKAAFRAYRSMEACVDNFYELLNSGLYRGVTGGVDYATQMGQIKRCGYMTSSTEVNSVIRLVKRYGLTKYDGATTPEKPIENPYRLSLPLMKKGDRGESVKWLQWQLKRVMGEDIKIDGIFGGDTERLLKMFQTVSKVKTGVFLKTDGIAGKETIGAIGAV